MVGMQIISRDVRGGDPSRGRQSSLSEAGGGGRRPRSRLRRQAKTTQTRKVAAVCTFLGARNPEYIVDLRSQTQFGWPIWNKWPPFCLYCVSGKGWLVIVVVLVVLFVQLACFGLGNEQQTAHRQAYEC